MLGIIKNEVLVDFTKTKNSFLEFVFEDSNTNEIIYDESLSNIKNKTKYDNGDYIIITKTGYAHIRKNKYIEKGYIYDTENYEILIIADYKTIKSEVDLFTLATNMASDKRCFGKMMSK
jgi:hypothetical protein